MDKSSRENYLVRIYRRDKEDPNESRAWWNS
jgi:hypothetical protein